jgi:hypothetical protein
MQIQNINANSRYGIFILAAIGGLIFSCGLVFLFPPLIGVGLFVVIYAAILYYGRARLGELDVQISNTTPRVGEAFTVHLQHSFKRGVQLHKFQVRLICREKVTHSKDDKNTITDIHDEVVASVDLPTGKYQKGQAIDHLATMQIPPDAMHTLKVWRNELLWFVQITASQPRLPDYVDEFELTVLPERVTEK